MSGKEDLRREIATTLTAFAIEYGISLREVMDIARTTMDFIEINSEY
ncbi:hypothetical protein EUAN_08870 [Andreesenia angusta]|uniref:Uncharacterized protein n=1 Tax=Andreesenia angusta TaxID=39480 RepID=A0A1S1V911_9FIRM|nr:hypothetical protein [Andreesenia angusta]OHW63103.1 hypothetical protein EUAN_08870 [Andreesenia angusta]